jgi:hypothetical protein
MNKRKVSGVIDIPQPKPFIGRVFLLWNISRISKGGKSLHSFLTVFDLQERQTNYDLNLSV